MVLGKGTAKQAKRLFKGKGVGGFRGVVRFWKGWCDNPSGSRPNSFGRQHLTFDKGGKNVVWGEGLLSFCNGCGDGEGRCNGRGKQGKDA